MLKSQNVTPFSFPVNSPIFNNLITSFYQQLDAGLLLYLKKESEQSEIKTEKIIEKKEKKGKKKRAKIKKESETNEEETSEEEKEAEGVSPDIISKCKAKTNRILNTLAKPERPIDWERFKKEALLTKFC